MEKLKNFMKTQGKDYAAEWWKVGKEFFFTCYLPSIICYLFVEICSRRSAIEVFIYLLRHPLVFFYNVLIIAATTSVALLFKRRNFVRLFIWFLWAVIGVTDLIVLSFRTTPFTAVDLLLIESALAIMDRYLSPFLIVLIGLLLAAAIFGLGVFFVKSKKAQEKYNYLVRIPLCAVVILFTLALTSVGMRTGFLQRNFGNLAQAFHDNGLPYCFMNSVLNTGVDRPSSYSPERMDMLLGEIEGNGVTPKPSSALVQGEGEKQPVATSAPVQENPDGKEQNPEVSGGQEVVLQPTKAPEEERKEYPNLIFLQLESFFDPKHISNISFNEDPVPFFTYLKEQYPSGYLWVPSVGAGTANTEFECITGMNLDMFGPGEYPYKTILMETTCESMPFVLKELGYTASAIHNNDGTFYGRNEVFPRLGFDRYISQEYMNGTTVNELNWIKDEILITEILRVLDTTEERDYIYTISVQGHGAYPSEPIMGEYKIEAQLPEELSGYHYQYAYYINQLFEMDLFLRKLTMTLAAWDEEVVLVLYGDHLPSLGLDDTLLDNEDIFQTEYVIWSNFTMEAEDRDLQAYQLAAHVCDLIDIHEGYMFRLHQVETERGNYRAQNPQQYTPEMLEKYEEAYQEEIQLLMYDMLYGNKEVFDGENPYQETEMKMGIRPIEITEVSTDVYAEEEVELMAYIYGNNFTEWSKVLINEKEVETIFLNSNLLVAMDIGKIPLKDGGYDVIVCQQDGDGLTLSQTEVFSYKLPGAPVLDKK